MNKRAKLLSYVCLLLMLYSITTTCNLTYANGSASIYGRVVDANTGLPISNATVLIWDLNTLDTPKLGAGIYFTDENGEYNVSDSYLIEGHTYHVLAYKGDFQEKTAEYVPAMKKYVYIGYNERKNASFSLIPGALIEMKGIPYLVTSPSPEAVNYIIKVMPKRKINVPFIDEYGNSPAAWWLGIGKNLIVIPANTPVTLEAQVWFFTRIPGRPIESESFFIYNESSDFLLSKGDFYTGSLSQHSLYWGLNFLKSEIIEKSKQLDKAQDAGFVVFDERRLLTSVHKNNMMQAETLLANAKGPDDYLDIWTKLREAFGKLNFISMSLDNKRLIGMTSAVYLSAVMAAFSTTLAFFFFESPRKKIFSNIAVFIAYLILLYFFHPGAHIIMEENAELFLESAVISFAGALLLVFGLPRIWKERSIEGEVSWRSAITIIFSMGKRQIRRRKIRGFFTILSIVILVIAFTSLTSFGTVFGIVSEEVGVTAPSDGVIVKRMVNRTSLLFSPLGTSSSEAISKLTETISKLVGIENVAPRLKNLPSSSPIVRLINPKEGRDWHIYGILGIEPINESAYTNLKEAVEGGYLSESGYNEILISRRVANALGVRIGENLTLDLLGTHVSTFFTVKGLIDDEKYMSLLDLDGTHFGPVRILEDGTIRTCNSTEVLITNLNAAENLQRLVNMRHPEQPSQILVLSELVFQPKNKENIDSMVKTLIFVFNYDVFVSQQRQIFYYHVGSYFEMKGAIELLVPLAMVGLNVGTVMLNSIYERRKEIRTLSMLGLNPTHIGLIFVAEAVILGMVGGSLGYIFGLGFYRTMALFGQDLMVREKLEWWWSAIGFAIAIAASVLSSIRPAILAVSTYTPSKVRKIKISEEMKKARREEIFKTYQARELSMPIKVSVKEILFFISFCLDRLNDQKLGILERIDNIEETPEMENVRGEIIKTIKFEYILKVSGQERRTKNTLVLTKSPDEDYYRVKLISEPAVLGLPESTIERTVSFVNRIIMDWAKNRERLISGF